MYLEKLGWNSYFQNQWNFTNQEYEAGRVAEENKGLYRVLTERNEYLCSVRGSARFQAGSSADLPVVGDWVAIARSSPVIEAVLPRRTLLKRKAAGRIWEAQLLCANIDFVFILTSLNQDLNLRRVERYLAIAWESGAEPVVLLTKADLVSDSSDFVTAVEAVAETTPVHALSVITDQGVHALQNYLKPGKTAAFIGSSGVGKSTLINRLMGFTHQRIAEIRMHDDHGRHTTTSRQLLILPGGAIVIDTPGMRELGLFSSEAGLTRTFSDVEEFAARCRFNDCRHSSEPDCAVQQAIADGLLPVERLKSFQKLQAELRFVSSKTDFNERRKAKENAKKMCKAHKRLYKDS